MRLESSLYASREGLVAGGQAISVIGDNISNSNTTGFKTSRIEFADMLAGGTSGDGDSISGEVGNGIKVSRVRQIFTNGTVEATGRTLDAGIGGDGFFITKEGSGTYYTRAGNFSINNDGLLVDQDGKLVQGYAAGATDTTTASDINMVKLGSTGTASSKISFSGNLASNAPLGVAPTTPTTMSDIVATGGAAFSYPATVYDSLGQGHSVIVAFTRTDALKWTAQAWMDGKELTGKTAGTPVLLGSKENLTFGSNGSIPTADQANGFLQAVGPVTFANGATAANVKVDLSGLTQYAATSIVNNIVNDGRGTGNIKSYEIKKDGRIIANLDSGVQQEIGGLALANFTNVDGLARTGTSSWKATDNAGKVTLNRPGSTGMGDVEGGALERSTVDIADQFVSLVVYQRGYQATSQTLNTTNQLLRDTLGLIR